MHNPPAIVPAHLKRSLLLAELLPYSQHVDATTLCTKSGEVLQILRLDGAAHESQPDDMLNAWHEQFHQVLRSVYDPHLAIWTHVVRRYVNDYPEGSFPTGFADELNDQYRARMQQKRMLVNELYLTLVLRPERAVAASGLAFLSDLRKKRAGDISAQLAMLRVKLRDITSQVIQGLDRYGPHLLSTYSHQPRSAGPALTCSEPYEFLGLLLNGEWERKPLRHGPVAMALSPSDGAGIIASSGIEQDKSYWMRVAASNEPMYSQVLGIREYPTATMPGFMDALLSAPFELVLGQSFAFIGRDKAYYLIRQCEGQFSNNQDFAVSQTEALRELLDDIASGRLAPGLAQLSLLVTARVETRRIRELGASLLHKGRADSAVFQAQDEALADLRESVAQARAMMADIGMVPVVESAGSQPAFFAMMPAFSIAQQRPSFITSRNFAAFAAPHNYPSGHVRGNKWGPAVALLRTTGGGPYYFNFHRADGGADPLGHTTIVGPSGGGKTVFELFMLSMLEKVRPTVAFFDKDHGAEIFIRAIGGTYLPLQNGQPTGFNPFQMQDSSANRLFLHQLVRLLIGASQGLSARDDQSLTDAISGVYALPPSARRLSAVLQFLDPSDPEGVAARLRKWCAHSQDPELNGGLWWVFDNATDTLDLTRGRVFGFDITAFLDNPETRSPIVAYLFYRVEQLIDGRPIAIFVTEFWKALLDPYFQEFARNRLKTLRKQNGVFITDTQSPSDALQSPIAKTIIEQSPTKVFLPNGDADYGDYVDGFKLTPAEFELVRTLAPKSRRLVIKQGEDSVVAELDLSGFDDALAVLSGNEANTRLVRSLVAELGDEPAHWLPEFHRRRRAG